MTNLAQYDPSRQKQEAIWAAADPEKVPFVLYLRPFNLDGAFVRRHPEYSSVTAGLVPQEVDLESLLTMGVERVAKFLKIEDPRKRIEHSVFAAGGVEYFDFEWQEQFERLSQHALAVVIVLGYGDAAAWELRSLRQRGLLGRCLFVLPEKADYPRAWDAAKEALRHIDASMPSDTGKVTLFRINSLGEADYVTAAQRDASWTVADMVADTIADNSPDGSWRKWTVGRRLHRAKQLAGHVLGWLLIGWLIFYLPNC